MAVTSMVMDNTYHDDKERQSLWYITAGDTDLYRKRNQIYDFADHSMSLALNAMKLRFDSMEVVEFRQFECLPEVTEEEQEDYEI